MRADVTVEGVVLTRAQLEQAMVELNTITLPQLLRVVSKSERKTKGAVIFGRVQQGYIAGSNIQRRADVEHFTVELQGRYTIIGENEHGGGATYETAEQLLHWWQPADPSIELRKTAYTIAGVIWRRETLEKAFEELNSPEPLRTGDLVAFSSNHPAESLHGAQGIVITDEASAAGAFRLAYRTRVEKGQTHVLLIKQGAARYGNVGAAYLADESWLQLISRLGA